LYTNIDQKLVNSLQTVELGGLHCCVITTGYRTRAQCIHMYCLIVLTCQVCIL